MLAAYRKLPKARWASVNLLQGARDKWKWQTQEERLPNWTPKYETQNLFLYAVQYPTHNIFSFLSFCILKASSAPVFSASSPWLNWMEAIIDKVEKLEIDTSNVAKWSDSEETTKGPLTPVSIDLHSDRPPPPLPLDASMITASPIQQHKRSVSAIYEYAIDSSHLHHQSSPDLQQQVHRNASHNKKKWFQLPRMNLKRQQSTPPKRGYGGLKAGLVEPPEPPPQLLFNLDWSTGLKGPTRRWENDVKQSASTPVTPVVSRRSSGAYSDTIFSTEYHSTRHKKSSSSVSSTSTAVPEQDDAQLESDMLAVRRLSCPDYNYQDAFLDEAAGNTASQSKPGSTSTKIFSNIPIHQRPNMKRGISTESVLCRSPSPSSSPSSVPTPPSSPPLSKSSADYKMLLFNVYAPDSGELILNFRSIEPRTVKLKRRYNLKSEQKALNEWQTQLLTRLKHSFSVQHRDNTIVSILDYWYLLRMPYWQLLLNIVPNEKSEVLLDSTLHSSRILYDRNHILESIELYKSGKLIT